MPDGGKAEWEGRQGFFAHDVKTFNPSGPSLDLVRNLGCGLPTEENADGGQKKWNLGEFDVPLSTLDYQLGFVVQHIKRLR